MSEKMLRCVKDFVESEPVKTELKNIILYVGQKIEETGYKYVNAPYYTSNTFINLLVGSKILQKGSRDLVTLTERGKEIYELLKKEETTLSDY
ncbi:MAG: hypothetical protein QXD55_00870 [Candidatus Aenigmatarchaeota archaeon]